MTPWRYWLRLGNRRFDVEFVEWDRLSWLDKLAWTALVIGLVAVIVFGVLAVAR